VSGALVWIPATLAVRERRTIYDAETGRKVRRLVYPASVARCLTCGRSWDDSKSTAVTPTPSGRCPFEYEHVDESATD
jgi:hypothetical protein